MEDKIFKAIIHNLKNAPFNLAYKAALRLEDLKCQEAAPHLMEVILDPAKRNLASVCLSALREIDERAYFAELTRIALTYDFPSADQAFGMIADYYDNDLLATADIKTISEVLNSFDKSLLKEQYQYEFYDELSKMMEGMKGKHPSVYIEYQDQAAAIDEKLAPLILTLWKNGIETLWSCQEEEQELQGFQYLVKMACIQFDGAKEAKKFLSFAVKKFKIYAKDIDEDFFDEINPFPLNHWKYDYYPNWDPEKKEVSLIMNVMFPTEHINSIVKIFNDQDLSDAEIKELQSYY